MPPTPKSKDKDVALHGYDAVFDPELDQKYSCPVCLAALRNPVQTKCGHRFCRSCLDHSRGKSSHGRCPVDKIWFDPVRHVFADNAIKREVLSLSVKCDHHQEGCGWKGELRHREDHLKSCPAGCVSCTNDCGLECKRRDLGDHIKLCPLRLEACEHCSKEIAATMHTKHHLLVCEKFPVSCSVCGESGILRERIPRHVDCNEGDCPLVVVKCQFEPLGCYFQDKRKNMKTHYQSANLHHMQLLTMKMQQQEGTLTSQQRRLEEVTDRCNELTMITDNQQRIIHDQGELIQLQASCIQELEDMDIFNGRLLWRLGVSPDSGSTYTSPSFYTGNPGYKVCFVLDTTGHSGENGSLFTSLYLKTEVGQFDNLFQFPFEGICHVTVFDQSGGKNNYKTSFSCGELHTTHLDEGDARPGLPSFMETNALFSWPLMKDNGLLILFDVCVNSEL